ncbi:hypothetical protein SeLEV6574_g05031 [Synchytrium endobioticum]|uniref:BolA protein n=1 Tax=Synchytrium endobioticum TaxID=286115 RepID=A0A507CXC2_9FUNG|nr:hypothetical protein SeLEV6574_g05031 [Synchytrium endobioticum]
MGDSGISQAMMEQALRAKLQATHVEVTDTSGGCGQSFEAVIVSELFAGRTLLQRHRLVNEALVSEISKIHAFSQKTFTPAQWAEKQESTP